MVDHAPVRQGRTNVCVCGELIASHRWFGYGPDRVAPKEREAHQWLAEHPAEAVAALIDAGALEQVRWRGADGSRYCRVVTDNQETPDA